MRRSIAIQQLQSQLACQGHWFVPSDNIYQSVDVCATPANIVTLATEVQQSLRRKYRNRYYVTTSIGQYSHLQVSASFASSFLQGPATWFFHHIATMQQLLLWPPSRYYLPNHSWLFHPWELVQFPELIRQLDRCSRESLVGSLLFDIQDPHFWSVLSECCLAVASGYRDVYLSDPECRCVYMLHHHDMIQLSVPNHDDRDNILLEFHSLYPDIDNLSNYA